jgi:hypothetical protein
MYLAWCAGQDVSPLAAQRAELERYIRWMQETAESGRRRSTAQIPASTRD